MTRSLEKLLNNTPPEIQSFLVFMPKVEITMGKRDYEMLRRYEQPKLERFLDCVEYVGGNIEFKEEIGPYRSLRYTDVDGNVRGINLAVSEDIRKVLQCDINEMSRLGKQLQEESNTVFFLRKELAQWEDASVFQVIRRKFIAWRRTCRKQKNT